MSFFTEHFTGGWIGLSGRTSLNKWYWSDSTPFSYSNWFKGKPSGEDDRCVHVSTKYILYRYIFFGDIYKFDILNY